MLIKKYSKEISKDNHALGKLRKEAEGASRALSNQHPVCVEIESLFDGTDFSEPPTHARLEELNNDLFRMTMVLVKNAMDDAGLEESQIHKVVSCRWQHQDSQRSRSSSGTTSTTRSQTRV
ncbi:Luminal-binding protein 2 [Triticum urartu]|uniref:Luminal-binding protein 2 n=2 Tax=Triticum urartu TaxID=4572 RepID=M8AGS3_TRIUA|nr:Luminal-binding protein 2 [Triticum urartu]